MAPVEEGDIAMWDNYSCFHSAVDYPLEGYGPRTMHQANIPGSRGEFMLKFDDMAMTCVLTHCRAHCTSADSCVVTVVLRKMSSSLYATATVTT